MARILVLTPQLPYPPQQGTSLRNLHLLKALSEQHQVTLLSFAEPDRPQEIEVLSSFCRVLAPIITPVRSSTTRFWQMLTGMLPDIALRLHSDQFDTALVAALADGAYDAVQVEGLELAIYISTIRSFSSKIRIVFDCHNAETELQKRSLATDIHKPSRWVAALYSWLQLRRLARFEEWALNSADAVIAVSENDRLQLQKLAPRKPIVIIPNTIDTDEYAWVGAVDPKMRYDLVFTGKMDYRPNVDGILWFVDNAWPKIIARRPQTTFAIVGQRPHSRLDRLRGLVGVTITGRVPSVHPYLAGASVYITPLRIGSGTRLKIIEAMAAGKPVISTRIGAEGFEVENRKNILLADSPAEWVEATLELLQNKNRQDELGAAAREFASQYDWRRIQPLFSTVYPD